MEIALLMYIPKGIKHLSVPGQCSILGHPYLSAGALIQILTYQVFHDDGQRLTIFVIVFDSPDVGVVETHHNLSLRTKPIGDGLFLTNKFRSQHLNGKGAPDIIFGIPDSCHTALADLTQQRIGQDFLY